MSNLREDGNIVVGEHEARLSEDFDAQNVAIPENVEGIILARIDNLSTKHRFYVKMISVVGVCVCVCVNNGRAMVGQVGMGSSRNYLGLGRAAGSGTFARQPSVASV